MPLVISQLTVGRFDAGVIGCRAGLCFVTKLCVVVNWQPTFLGHLFEAFQLWQCPWDWARRGNRADEWRFLCAWGDCFRFFLNWGEGPKIVDDLKSEQTQKHLIYGCHRKHDGFSRVLDKLKERAITHSFQMDQGTYWTQRKQRVLQNVSYKKC